MRLKWTPLALEDLDRIWEFNSNRTVEQADRIDDRIKTGVLILARMPRIGRRLRGDLIREWSMTDIQYVARYRILEEEDVIEIPRVHHTREDRGPR